MKNISKALNQLTVLVCITTVLFLFGCKKNNVLPPEQQRIQDLTATWQLGSVTNDNTDVTNQFTGFTLLMAGQTFTTTNGGNAWASSGNYNFVDGDINQLLREDGVEVSIDAISDSTLEVSFTVNQVNMGGRVTGITGNFTFSLNKQ